MINPAPEIRKSLFALLNGSIAYNATQVPVYEGQDSDIVPYKIIIGDFTDADRSNKHFFSGQGSQVIEVVAEQPTGIKKHVDAIGSLVMNTVHPAPRSELWTTGPLTISVQGKPAQSHLIEDSGEGGKIVRLILRYNLLVNEN